MSDTLLVAGIITDAESSEWESELSEIDAQVSDNESSSSNSSSSSIVCTTDDAETESNSSVIVTQMPKLVTYKLVGDNIDKDVKPRQMRFDYQTRSLHYFHTYALQDRVDLSSLSDEPRPLPTPIDLTVILPDKADDECLQNNFAILMSRVVCKYVPFFSRYKAERHIKHEYSRQMSHKSVVVSSM